MPSSPAPAETLSASWAAAPPTPQLRPGEVHLWRADLDAATPDEVRRLAATLSPDEGVRAGRFVFAREQRRFAVARAALRAILSRYVGAEPGRIALAATPAGKPMLAEPPHAGALRFSVSHSAQIALYALTLHRDVGVDVEYQQPAAVADLLDARVLSAREIATLSALSPEARAAAFFTVWTRKEAYVKARGRGLALSFQAFTVSADPSDAALLDAEDDDPARWTLLDVEAGADCAAALAVEGALTAVRYWTWSAEGLPVSGR